MIILVLSVEAMTARLHRGNMLFYRAVHLDSESAVIAQNDEFKAVLIQ